MNLLEHTHTLEGTKGVYLCSLFLVGMKVAWIKGEWIIVVFWHMTHDVTAHLHTCYR